jgi:energy-converting hydrogenase Eha subunit C
MTDTNRARWDTPALKWGLAALVLAAGYLDLARGGETIAPILLVLGYGILVPLAIFTETHAGE